MKTQADKTQESQNSITPRVSHEPSNGGTAQLVDNRSATIDQRKLQKTMNTSTENSANPIQRKTKKTGLPDNLKSGIENLSGHSMDDVKVHYNSSKPAQLQAHAYAQGTDIHLAPGQQKHLPHEAWHVVQQKQGRVKPTRQLKSQVSINDDVGLEKEADVMGEKALQMKAPVVPQKNGPWHPAFIAVQCVIQRKELATDKLNVVGETHSTSNVRRPDEMEYCELKTGSKNYWEEQYFKASNGADTDLISMADPLDLRIEHDVIGFAACADVIYGELDQGDKEEVLEGIEEARVSLESILEEIAELKTGKDGYEIGAPRREEFLALEKLVEKRLDKAILRAVKARREYELKAYLKDADFGAFMLWKEEIFDLLKLKEKYNAIDTDKLSIEIGKRRSIPMHAAANRRCNTLGVWKIGDSHIDDMIKMTPKHYHYLTEKEFNEGFDPWFDKRPKPDPMMSEML